MYPAIPEPVLATNTGAWRVGPVPLTPADTEELFAAHAHGVYRYARARLPVAEAEDVVAEVFAIAWRKGELPDNPRAWLLSVARRVMANQLRAQHRRTALAERARTHPSPPGHDDTRLVGELDELRRALDLLRPADREVIALLAAAELSTAEVARVLGCSTATAATRVHRARRRLRAAYGRLNEEGS
ncbi:RNA polymerase sigma factor [Myceligenerans indicum]|uniref:RNA polymerase sigma factor n=1 Tax=Myceligenerans indicum TaxID=2593663 RepID=A0ABS1LGA4_9MICO|nr:RNA polymerase sigma factor [Myceligenerans indicum]MBL0885188.1 RNA polymerase sigma factor [Myceligenerans indicum]